MFVRKCVLIFCFLFSVGASASEVEDAVSKTQQDLRSDDRSKLLNTPKAQGADLKARQTVGAENIDQVYAISADILPTLMKQAGTPEAAAAMLEKAKTDPAGFLKSLPPEIQQQIKDLSRKIEQDPSFKGKKSQP